MLLLRRVIRSNFVLGARGVHSCSSLHSSSSPSSSSASTFIDRIRIFVSGGRGGQGLGKHTRAGGNGGNVIVVANASMNNLRDVANKKRYNAPSGEAATKYRQPRPGKDVVINVPVGTSVMLETGRPLGDLTHHGEELLVAKGGEGGSYLTSENFVGLKGDRYHIVLELKSIADIGLVGFPNAGKSSLLRSLSRARPQVANYPFTTLRPNIGIIEYDDFTRLRMADIPGLIEGAHENKGMGHAFLRHIERTKLLLYVIDVGGFQLGPSHPFRTAKETLELLVEELDQYDPALRASKPAIVALNKMDVDDSAELAKEFMEECQQIVGESVKICQISTKTSEGLDDITHTLIENLADRKEKIIKRDLEDLEKYLFTTHDYY